MRFQKIVMLDSCGLVGEYKDKIGELSTEEVVAYDSLPHDNAEIIRRIADADCVLVSWNTKVDAEVLKACPSVRYVGMCCSLYDEESANVDIKEARRQGIMVKGVRDYGDNGTVEFIFAELIALMKGLGKHQWLDEATELTGKTIGIIGMGVLGKMVAQTAVHFGMSVIYHSRTRKPEIESQDIRYETLEELLSLSDIISLHVPRNSVVLDKENFRKIKKNAIFINTSLGQPFEEDAFFQWLNTGEGNYALFDSAGYNNLREALLPHSNVILFDQSSGFTREAKHRLTEKVWRNMKEFLKN